MCLPPPPLLLLPVPHVELSRFTIDCLKFPLSPTRIGRDIEWHRASGSARHIYQTRERRFLSSKPAVNTSKTKRVFSLSRDFWIMDKWQRSFVDWCKWIRMIWGFWRNGEKRREEGIIILESESSLEAITLPLLSSCEIVIARIIDFSLSTIRYS